MSVETKKHRLTQAIRQRIAAGEFADGRLASLRALAEEYRVSPGSVRDALLELERRGLISSRHGSGYFVRPPSEKPLCQILLLDHGTPGNPHVEELHTLVAMHCDQALFAERCDLMSHEELWRKLRRYAGLPVKAIFVESGVAERFSVAELKQLREWTALYFFGPPGAGLLEAGVPGVSCDEYLIGYKGVRHLLEVGCRRILMAEEGGALRCAGARAAVEESLDKARLRFHNEAEFGAIAAEWRADGLFFASDEQAHRIEARWHLGDTIALLGCSGSAGRNAPESTLSSVDFRPEAVINRLWGMYRGEIPALAETLPPGLVLRGSTLRNRPDAVRPELIRLSRRGETLLMAQAHFGAEIKAIQPDAVIVLLGSMDMLHSVHLATPEQFSAALERLLDILPGRVVLLTLPHCVEAKLFERHDRRAYLPAMPNDRIDTANAELRRQALARNLPCIDLHTLAASDGALLPDGVCLSEECSARLAREVAVVFAAMSPAPRRIVCLGDSNTYGCYGGRSYVDFLEKYCCSGQWKDEDNGL